MTLVEEDLRTIAKFVDRHRAVLRKLGGRTFAE
jgi:hypothetical protein